MEVNTVIQSNLRINLAGTPPNRQPGAISFVTTAPPATVEPAPICTPSKMAPLALI